MDFNILSEGNMTSAEVLSIDFYLNVKVYFIIYCNGNFKKKESLNRGAIKIF